MITEPGRARDDASLLSVSLKVDVDTLEGYLEGVPRLLDLFARLSIPATFCIAMGPDCSGRAIWRIFTHRGFLGKMLRTRAAATYSRRTMLYGTLLPAPQIVATRPEIITETLAAGHEVIPHGWDHVGWHDHLRHWGPERTRRELARACEAYTSYSGRPCHAFAAPGWQATDRSLQAQAELGLRYSADTRGLRLFWPVVGGKTLDVLQIPTTLPTLDELIGRPEVGPDTPLPYLLGLLRQPPALPGDASSSGGWGRGFRHVFTCHAEVEGAAWIGLFEELLRALLQEGVPFLTLDRLSGSVRMEGDTPRGTVSAGMLPGRAGTVSVATVA